MATKVWAPQAPSIKQVASGSIDSVDATPSNNTFTVTIGNVSVSVAGDTDVATTATNLVAALNASTGVNEAFSSITWANPSSGTITATADVPGMPFTAALTETGAGTGTVTDFSDTTANSSPYDAGDAVNWGGTLPVAADDIVIGDTAIGLLYGLEALSGVALGTVNILHSFTGAIGLEAGRFAKDEGAVSLSTKMAEYRPTHWKIDADRIVIGDAEGAAPTNGGASRICIDNEAAGASLFHVARTKDAASAVLPAVRYLVASASAEVQIDYAPAGVGVACEAGNTSTVSVVKITDTSTASRATIGEGTTITTFEQDGGVAQLAAAAAVTTVMISGGELDITGADYGITTLDIDGGTVRDAHERVTGDEWTTITIDGQGVLDLRGSRRARTAGTTTLCCGTLHATDDVTFTTYNAPTQSVFSATVPPAGGG